MYKNAFPTLWTKLEEMIQGLERLCQDGKLRFYHLRNVVEYSREVIVMRSNKKFLGNWNLNLLHATFPHFIREMHFTEPFDRWILKISTIATIAPISRIVDINSFFKFWEENDGIGSEFRLQFLKDLVGFGRPVEFASW